MRSYKFFTLSEFDSPDRPGTGALMCPAFLDALDNARAVAGVPFIINSGLRTPEHNQAVGGVQTSSHLYGLAADIASHTTGNGLRIVHGLVTAGFRRIGIAESYIHVDLDGQKEAAVWRYPDTNLQVLEFAQQLQRQACRLDACRDEFLKDVIRYLVS